MRLDLPAAAAAGADGVKLEYKALKFGVLKFLLLELIICVAQVSGTKNVGCLGGKKEGACQNFSDMLLLLSGRVAYWGWSGGRTLSRQMGVVLTKAQR